MGFHLICHIFFLSIFNSAFVWATNVAGKLQKQVEFKGTWRCLHAWSPSFLSLIVYVIQEWCERYGLWQVRLNISCIHKLRACEYPFHITHLTSPQHSRFFSTRGKKFFHIASIRCCFRVFIFPTYLRQFFPRILSTLDQSIIALATAVPQWWGVSRTVGLKKPVFTLPGCFPFSLQQHNLPNKHLTHVCSFFSEKDCRMMFPGI